MKNPLLIGALQGIDTDTAHYSAHGGVNEVEGAEGGVLKKIEDVLD